MSKKPEQEKQSSGTTQGINPTTDISQKVKDGLDAIIPAIKSVFKSIGNFFLILLALFSTLIVFVYYQIWSLKIGFKRITVVFSYLYIFLSALRFAGEGFAELKGAHWISDILQAAPISATKRLALFVAAVSFILVISFTEMKKPQYESAFVEGLLHAMSRKRARRDDWASLQIFHALFARCKVKHVSVYRFDEANQRLEIIAVYPEEADANYYQLLAANQGVAGRVYSDLKPRYVTRLFLITFFKNFRLLYMPHAVQFEQPQKLANSGGNSEKEVFKLKKKMIEADVVWSDSPKKLSYSSFLSVPILSPSGKECLGVLNFDFTKRGNLSLVDITMACVLGIWFGLELIERKDVASSDSVVSSNIPDGAQAI